MDTTRRAVVALTLLALLAAMVGPAGAGGRATDAPAPGQASHDYVTVQLKDPPIASYTGGIKSIPATKPARGRLLDLRSSNARAYADHLAGERGSYRSWLRSNAPRATVAREFSAVFNGLVVKLNGENRNNLTRGPGVRAVTPSFLVRPAMNVSPGVINAEALWAAAGGQGNAGSGINVGIIDSGIDISGPFFTETGYGPVTQINQCGPFTKPGGANTNNKVFVCRYFVSGVAPGALTSTDALLAFDHGTHVAGTVAGTANISGTVQGTTVVLNGLTGIAPRARLGDYNVFPGFGSGFVAFGGSAFSHDIIAALDAAVADGMHVVNLSLGGSVQGPHDTLAEAINATADAGVVPAVAAGNSGPGDSTVTSPGNAARALTAGASTNPHFVGIPVTVGGSTFGAALGDFANFGVVTNAAYTVTSPANGCTALNGNVAGKIALIDRGVCTFTTKVRNAQNAGAIGVLVVNNVAGDPIAMGQDGTTPVPTIPAAMLSQGDGNSIKPSGTVSINGTAPAEFVTTNQDILAGFSSRGPTPFTFLVKPDATAPGVNVASSVFGGLFAFFQGTSMATPHFAGSAALLKQAHPGWSPEDIKSALVNTAERVVTDHIAGTSDPGVLARGGGRINLGLANGTPATIDPVSASFGRWTGNKSVSGTVNLLVRNVSGVAQSCSLSTSGSGGANVSVSPTSLALAAGTAATVAVSLSAGRTGQTPSGDYTADVEIECGTTTLLVPWWVRIDREGKP